MLALYIGLPLLLILVGAWLFLIATPNGKGLEGLLKRKIAHRGLHGEGRGELEGEPYAAENSMTAFRRAMKAGYAIEIDVHTSLDGVVVIHHDADLKRVEGIDKKVKELTAEELAGVSLSGTSDGVPTLRELLDTVKGEVPILIEIKEEGSDHTTTEKLVEELRSYSGEYYIQSFNPISLGVVKKLLPEAKRGFLCDHHTLNAEHKALKFHLLERMLLNVVARPHFISMEKNQSKLFPLPLIKRLFRPALICWTVRSPEEEDAAFKAGFENVIFENYNA